jgi:outer membrane protein assembly factor BamD
MRGDRFFAVASGLCLTACFAAGVSAQQKAPAQQPQSGGKIKVITPKTAPTPAAAQDSSEPDKVLYERAMTDLKKKRYTEERLSLETLINTYPDSEYLDKAKLAIADSYYDEGGISNLTQAIGEYKSFIVFFPNDDKAPYAQMQIGMAHLKMMEKSDRDTSESLNAEAELQIFVKTYPDNKLAPVAEQQLRDVQEVIADGEFKVARFYYLRPDYKASAARLVELTERYPLYSQSDEALWMLSNIYGLARKFSKNEDDKNHWADLQGKVLDQLVTNYPLSVRTAAAKDQLKAMGMAVPDADPTAAARMQKQQAYIKSHKKNGMMASTMGLVKTGPDFSLAAQSGMPNLNPPSDSISAKDMLLKNDSGPQFNLAASGSSGGGRDLSGDVVPVTSVITEAPASTATSDTNSNLPATAAAPTANDTSNNDPVGQVNLPTTTVTSTASGDSSTGATTSATSTDPDNPPQTSAPGSSSSKAAPPVGANESSSKKKKGLSKLNPF